MTAPAPAPKGGAPAGAPVAVVDAPAPAVRLDPALTAPPAALAIVQPAAVAPVVVQGIEFTPERVELVKRTIAKNATNDELELFLYTCRRLRLDPFARQIYFMKRSSSGDDDAGSDTAGRSQVSIDGLRLIAERTGEYQGQTPPEWARVTITDHGPVVDWLPVWPYAEPPQSARIGVYRSGFREPMYAVARFDAYKVTKRGGALNRMWAKMGPEQLAKCAEALALRKAFPQELSGVYTPDEMEQADQPDDDDMPAGSRAPAQQSARRDTSTSGAARADAQRNERNSGERTPTARAATTADRVRREPETPAYAFPFSPRRGIPLDARHPVGHELAGTYIVSDDMILRAYAWADDCLNGKPFQRPNETEKRAISDDERPKFEAMRAAMLRESDNRIEERTARQIAADDAIDAATDAANAQRAAAEPSGGDDARASDGRDGVDSSTGDDGGTSSGGTDDTPKTADGLDIDDDLPF